MSFFDTQNPGIGGLDEITDAETLTLQSISALGDPGADRLLFWDESANDWKFLTAGSGLTITGTTITASASGVSGTINEIAYFDTSTSVASLAVATYPSLTELSYVKGVTSAIQTQFTGKAALALSNLASVAINTTLVSDTDNTDALGTTAIAWSDLFLGSGAVITFNSAPSTADITITHSADTLTFAGGTIVLGTATAAGGLTGNVTGNVSGTAATVTTAAQPAITSLGTLTTLTVDDITINGNTISSAGASTLAITPTAGQSITLDGTVTIDAGVVAGMTALTMSGNVIMGVNSITMTGSLAATGARVTKGWFTDIESTNMPTVGGTAILTSLTAPQFTTIELGHATDTTLARVSAGVISVEGVTVPTISSTSTITNKRIEPRIVSAASYTTDTGTSLDVSTTDIFVITAQAGALLFNAPGGTPVQGQRLVIRIKDNGTARALTWNAVFRAMGTALPSTTVLSKTLYLGFFYNSTDTKWDLVASAQEA